MAPTIQPEQVHKGYPYPVEAENTTGAHSTRLDASVLPIWHQRPGGSWRTTGISGCVGSPKKFNSEVSKGKATAATAEHMNSTSKTQRQAGKEQHFFLKFTFKEGLPISIISTNLVKAPLQGYSEDLTHSGSRSCQATANSHHHSF